MNRILFFSFQTINKGLPSGIVKFAIHVVDSFLSDNPKDFTYYVSKISGTYFSKRIKELSWVYKFLIKIITVFNKYIKLPVYRIRLIHEIIYDFFASRKISRGSVVISTTYLNRTLKKNNRLGGINVLIAGNPDDYYIYKLLLKEQYKHNIIIQDAYTYRSRVCFGLKSTRLFDYIICSSSSEIVTYTLRFPSEKLIFIPCQIIPNKKVFKDITVKHTTVFTVCYIAYSTWIKGLIYLLEGWKIMENLPVRLVIGGKIDHNLDKVIKERYNNLKNVEYIGFVPDLNQFYRSADLFICPSIIDGGPAIVAEAMYCRLPVIVTEGCGAKDLIVNGQNGFVVPALNTAALGNKIRWCYENRFTLHSIGKMARKTIDNYPDLKEVSSNIKEAILKFVEEKRSINE